MVLYKWIENALNARSGKMWIKIIVMQEFECRDKDWRTGLKVRREAIKVKAIEGDRLLPIFQYLSLKPVKGSKLCSISCKFEIFYIEMIAFCCLLELSSSYAAAGFLAKEIDL